MTKQEPSPLASAGPRDVAQETVRVLTDGGASVAIYVPDSVLIGLTHALERDAAIRAVVASREDEAFAIATGVALAGGTPVVLMEGSGVGYCGLILARAQLMHVGVLVIASHSPALGERYEYHARDPGRRGLRFGRPRDPARHPALAG